jgi:hypothetical protein
MWEKWIEQLWIDHLRVNPQAGEIRSLLKSKGEQIFNDHIALRTFAHKGIDIESIAPQLIKLGYRSCGDYQFKQKKLLSQHFEHRDAQAPKIFLSELQQHQLSKKSQALIAPLLAQCEMREMEDLNYWGKGCLWHPVTKKAYEELYEETEVGAWLATMGFRANHFTVRVNDLKSFEGLAALNEFLKKHGYRLNTSGGEIKGSAEQGLEQSSTLAHRMLTPLADGELELPTCFDEFALRHKDANGQIFTGFLTNSADKIFESTN